MSFSYRFLVAACLGVFAAACGGKVVVDGLDGVGGSGGAGGSTSTGTTTIGPSTSTSVTVTSTGTVPSTSTGINCDPSLTCSEALSGEGDPGTICPGSVSEGLYLAFFDCACGGGACATECIANACSGNDASQSCIQCVQSPMGCGSQFNDCANDF